MRWHLALVVAGLSSISLAADDDAKADQSKRNP